MIKNILSGLLLACTLLVSYAGTAQDQKAIDDKVLTNYFAAKHIKATKTPSGLYYTINKKGAGENAKSGMKVSMLYYGYTLDGKRFDGNMDQSYNPAGNPFQFNLGSHQVIAGWDEGVQLLNKGCRATLYLPSGLAYGARGAGGAIGPNAVLAFDVELVSMN
jgi:FKBP-type peptidyl-prolyl cis-trans isomerase FkpA